MLSQEKKGTVGLDRLKIETVCHMQIEGKLGPGRPKMTWKTHKERDCREWNLNEVDPCDRDVWRSSVRSAVRAASQLPGKEPTDVDDAPAPTDVDDAPASAC